MVTPDAPEDYVTFDLAEDGRPYGTLYITHEVWDGRDPKATELIFHIQDYGRFRLKIHG